MLCMLIVSMEVIRFLMHSLLYIYVNVVDTFSTQYTHNNGMHVDAVNTIELQSRF